MEGASYPVMLSEGAERVLRMAFKSRGFHPDNVQVIIGNKSGHTVPAEFLSTSPNRRRLMRVAGENLGLVLDCIDGWSVCTFDEARAFAREELERRLDELRELERLQGC